MLLSLYGRQLEGYINFFRPLRCFLGNDWDSVPNECLMVSRSGQNDRLHPHPLGGLAMSSSSGEDTLHPHLRLVWDGSGPTESQGLLVCQEGKSAREMRARGERENEEICDRYRQINDRH